MNLDAEYSEIRADLEKAIFQMEDLNERFLCSGEERDRQAWINARRTVGALQDKIARLNQEYRKRASNS